MKKSTIALLTALTLSPASQASDESMCDSINTLAATAMQSRQNGVPAINLINAVKNMDGAKYAILIIKDAFSTPKYSTERYKESATVEFANKWYMACLSAGGNE